MAGNKNSGRPGGNPNIATARKTGPRTKRGKLKIAEVHLKHGNHSKLIEEYRRGGCDKCPLREKKYTISVGDKEITKTERAMCGYYKEGSKECRAPLQDTIARIKNYTMLSKINLIDIHDELIRDGIVDLELNRFKEIQTKGAPGYYSKEFREMLLKAIETREKLKNEKERILTPQKIQTENKNLNVNVNTDFIPEDEIYGKVED